MRDAARATSAAPSYFPAKFIRGLGFLQDGGAGKHNNPIDAGEWESNALWETDPDVTVSVGTGYARAPDTPPIVSQRLHFRDRFLPRVFRLFNAVLSAQGSWDDHLNRINKEERCKYFRVNMGLDKEPDLDDASQISAIKRWSKDYLETYDFVAVLRALFASCFFFELYRTPTPRKEFFICTGSIRCRSPDTRALVKRMLEEYPSAFFATEDGTRLGHTNDRSLCITCGRYRKEVAFKVYHINQSFSIYVHFSALWRSRISGFPQDISSLREKQMLDADFGRPDHQIVQYEDLGRCLCESGKKRKGEHIDVENKPKRLCIRGAQRLHGVHQE